MIAVTFVSAAMLAGCAGGPPAQDGSALSDGKVVIGILNDQSGVYRDLSGPNSRVAVELAIADYEAKYGDEAVATDIEIITSDHQNKPDVANTQAQQMYDRRGADIILDVPTSSAALAVAEVAAAKKRLFIDVGAATMELTGAACNPYTFHWAYNTEMLAKGASGVVDNGGESWVIIYPDYAFGQGMNASFTASIEGAGGTVLESIATPFPNDNFSTFITRAAAQNPDVIGIMAAGGDLINFVKQYNQAGMQDQAALAVGLMFITDINSLGVEEFQGTTFTDAWYWDYDEQNREFADRFLQLTDARPTFAHAGNYSAAFQYLEAIQRAGTDDADAVIAELEGAKLEDLFLRNGEVRSDHSVVHDSYVARVKPAADVAEAWDYEEIISTIPAEEAFSPVNSACTM
ncbi:ABC transporter substrate-binding protein [Salinibacterium sp. G-O1]|uniref:ABC transporter substrate-binding protein n=1 Tax=Salinibacterium sp. G-O1 TaxID=3046208 RepID=UPI0024B9DFDB|nr:ABC transporter substrate-binding protein [Salinibacterium sp. G-O1]MDJ0335031.1 ABC transporter substrate-binding protein [Salinibacterium sp. G-O1]